MSGPYTPPESGPDDPGSGFPPQKPKKRHRLRNILLTIGGLAVVLIVVLVAVAIAVGSNPAGPATSSVATTTAATPSSAAPASQSAAAPSPSLKTPTKVEFIISGDAPGDGYGNGPTIDYGSSSSTHEADPGRISGTLTYSVPFDPSAEYYSVNASLAGSGHITCKIVVTGPYPDKPLTVSSGDASGGYSECMAQAAPSDSSGLSWQDEQ